MRPVEFFRLALQALRSNWLRGVLTALGVIIGVASLVSLTAVGAGARAGVEADLERLGPNLVILDGEVIVLPDGTESPSDRTITRWWFSISPRAARTTSSRRTGAWLPPGSSAWDSTRSDSALRRMRVARWSSLRICATRCGSVSSRSRSPTASSRRLSRFWLRRPRLT